MESERGGEMGGKKNGKGTKRGPGAAARAKLCIYRSRRGWGKGREGRKLGLESFRANQDDCSKCLQCSEPGSTLIHSPDPSAIGPGFL